MDDLIKIFSALSEPNRVKILKMLELRPLCVCEFPDALELSVSTVSKHLSLLRDAGLINDKKIAKWVYYKLNTDSKDLKVRQLLSLLPMWLNDEAPIRLLKEKIVDEKNVDLCNF